MVKTVIDNACPECGGEALPAKRVDEGRYRFERPVHVEASNVLVVDFADPAVKVHDEECPRLEEAS